MKLLGSASFALFLSLVASSPMRLARRTMASNDVTILQFALTLEHLENSFYKQGLSSFSEKQFQEAGFSSAFFESVQFDAADEQAHVELLTVAIKAAGQPPVAACKYKFPFTDVKTFITISSVLEGIGTSAYLGAAALVIDKSILTTAASIMVNEALHTSTQREAIGLVPAPNPLGTPLDANSVFTLAASFIESCPSTNAPLPFVAFPSLTFSSDSSCDSSGSSHSSKDDNKSDKNSSKSQDKYNSKSSSYSSSSSSSSSYSSSSSSNKDCNSLTQSSGDIIVLVADTSKVKMPSDEKSISVTFVNGLSTISVEIISIDRAGSKVSAKIPSGLSGQTFVFITIGAIGTVIDSAILFGPAAIEIAPGSPKIDNSVL